MTVITRHNTKYNFTGESPHDQIISEKINKERPVENFSTGNHMTLIN
jgi:secreted Zn-dependent insulinase-like peptidase